MIARVGLFAGHRGPGPKWYVNSITGNDTNSGRSAGAALRTIAALSPKIAAGDSVGLARGSHFRETFTVPQNNVTVEAYGSGALPILDCSDPIAVGAWSATGGQTITYQASVTHDIALGKTFIGVWENGARMIYQTSVALVNANPGSYTLSDTSGSPASPVTIYVSASDGSNPATNGKTYEYASRTFGLTCGGVAHCTISSIQTQRNLHNDGSLILGYYTTVRNCVAADGNYHNVYVNPGCSLYNVTALRAYHPLAMGLFIWYGTFAGENLYFENCQALLDTYTSGMGGGFGGHAASGSLGTVTFKNCISQNCDIGFAGNVAATVLVDGCSTVGPCSYNVNGDAGFTTSLTVSNCTFANTQNRMVSSVASGCAVSISNTTATSVNGSTGLFINGSTNVTASITDSTFTGLAWPLSASGCAGLNWTFLRNTLVGANNLAWFDPVPATINSDYNSVPTGLRVQWGVANNLSWAQYRAISTQDFNSNPAPNWYVDSVNGVDSNAGTSAAAAFKSIGKLATVISDYSRVALARGSAWREKLLLANNYVQLVPYGTGAAPLFDASDPVFAGTWSKAAGRTITYQASVTHELAGGEFMGCWENGARLAYRTTAALVDANPGSYTLSDLSNTPVSPLTLYVSASDGSNPATNGKVYEYSSHTNGVVGNSVQYAVVQGIQARRPLADSGINLGGCATVVDCAVTDAGQHSIYLNGGGAKLFRCTASGMYHPTATQAAIMQYISPANNEGMYFESCTVTQGTPNTGFGFGSSGTGTLGTVSFVNCTTVNCNTGFSPALASTVVMTGCTISGSGQYGLDFAGATTVSISGLTTSGLTSRCVAGGASNATITIANSSLSGAGATGVFLNGLTGIALTVTGCTFAGLGYLIGCDNGPDLASLTFTHNSVASASNMWWIGTPPPTLASDYNTLPAGGVPMNFNGNGWSWAAWKANTGQDAHSTP